MTFKYNSKDQRDIAGNEGAVYASENAQNNWTKTYTDATPGTFTTSDITTNVDGFKTVADGSISIGGTVLTVLDFSNITNLEDIAVVLDTAWTDGSVTVDASDTALIFESTAVGASASATLASDVTGTDLYDPEYLDGANGTDVAGADTGRELEEGWFVIKTVGATTGFPTASDTQKSKGGTDVGVGDFIESTSDSTITLAAGDSVFPMDLYQLCLLDGFDVSNTYAEVESSTFCDVGEKVYIRGEKDSTYSVTGNYRVGAIETPKFLLNEFGKITIRDVSGNVAEYAQRDTSFFFKLDRNRDSKAGEPLISEFFAGKFYGLDVSMQKRGDSLQGFTGNVRKSRAAAQGIQLNPTVYAVNQS